MFSSFLLIRCGRRSPTSKQSKRLGWSTAEEGKRDGRREMLDRRLVVCVSKSGSPVEWCLSHLQRRRPGGGEEVTAQCHGKRPPGLQTFVPGSVLPGLGIPDGKVVLIM